MRASIVEENEEKDEGTEERMRGICTREWANSLKEFPGR